MAGAPSIVPAHSKRLASDFGKADWVRSVNADATGRRNGGSRFQGKKTSMAFNQDHSIDRRLLGRTIKVMSSLLSLLNFT